ncbi:MAG: 4Fe-4S binding protein [Mariprofundales bacterium]|nr:4Fe-4S binding protein [Mariprofundales bacterium]
MVTVTADDDAVLRVDRRNFFKHGAASVARVVKERLQASCNARAQRWIRPPHALPEVDFLLACTRCDACVEACPHGVVFLLPLSCGVQVAGTPALDLAHKGCHLCDDWPCVAACQSKALQLPDAELPATLPILARVSIDPELCLPYQGPECGVCQGVCPQPAALLWDGAKPYIDSEKCVGCALCREACFLEEKAIRILSTHAQATPNP